tara:strand:+ start:480 stop:716 length:237 start_codon:yes stop_codon:yes gene_type:complete
MKQVKIKYNKSLIDGLLYKDKLTLPAHIEIADTVNIDGVDVKVLSTSVDYRDEVQTIELAMASAKKEKSDDKPTKGRD